MYEGKQIIQILTPVWSLHLTNTCTGRVVIPRGGQAACTHGSQAAISIDSHRPLPPVSKSTNLENGASCQRFKPGVHSGVPSRDRSFPGDLRPADDNRPVPSRRSDCSRTLPTEDKEPAETPCGGNAITLIEICGGMAQGLAGSYRPLGDASKRKSEESEGRSPALPPHWDTGEWCSSENKKTAAWFLGPKAGC
jgi:hypothetical protein